MFKCQSVKVGINYFLPFEWWSQLYQLNQSNLQQLKLPEISLNDYLLGMGLINPSLLEFKDQLILQVLNSRMKNQKYKNAIFNPEIEISVAKLYDINWKLIPKQLWQQIEYKNTNKFLLMFIVEQQTYTIISQDNNNNFQCYINNLLSKTQLMQIIFIQQCYSIFFIGYLPQVQNTDYIIKNIRQYLFKKNQQYFVYDENWNQCNKNDMQQPIYCNKRNKFLVSTLGLKQINFQNNANMKTSQGTKRIKPNQLIDLSSGFNEQQYQTGPSTPNSFSMNEMQLKNNPQNGSIFGLCNKEYIYNARKKAIKIIKQSNIRVNSQLDMSIMQNQLDNLANNLIQSLQKPICQKEENDSANSSQFIQYS